MHNPSPEKHISKKRCVCSCCHSQIIHIQAAKNRVSSGGKMKKLSEISKIVFLVLLFFSLFANRTFSQQWAINYQSPSYTTAVYALQPTSDGGYILAGKTHSGTSLNNLLVLKVSPNGSIDWQKSYYNGPYNEEAYSVQQTFDGGYIVAGYTESSYSTTSYDLWLLKLHADGTVEWEKTYGAQSADLGMGIQQTPDGGYIVAGNTSSFGAGGYDAWVLKLNSDGSVAWQKGYGGPQSDVAESIQQTADGGYVVVGSTYSFGGGYSDAWVLKLNSDGSVAWQKAYGGPNYDQVYSVHQTSDEGYILAGYKEQTLWGDCDAWVMKLNADGSVAWQKTYGGQFWDGSVAVQETSDGGYVVGGSTNSFGAGDRDVWVLKLNSDGTVAWEKTYGGSGYEHIELLKQTSDDGYVIFGYSSSFIPNGVWALKLDSEGNLLDCPITGTSSATVAEPSITTSDTSVTVLDTTVSPQTSAATVQDTDIVENVVCVGEEISAPSTPSGPATGGPDMIYTYSTEGASSDYDHPIQYLFDWGDGTNSGWLPEGITSASKSWDSTGTYLVKARARCAIHTSTLSTWSETLSVEVSWITLQSPSHDTVFDSCALINPYQPQFNWTSNGTYTRFTLFFSTSPTDFITRGVVIVKASISASSNSWKPSSWNWKRIMESSNNNGSIRPIYWKVVGTKSDRTIVESEVWSFSMGAPQPVAINAPLDGAILDPNTPPTFDLSCNCNTKFRLEISSLSDFSVSTNMKAFNFTASNPNLMPTLQKTLSSFQWNGVKKLVGTGTGYFRIKAYDAIKRETTSEVRSFTIQ